MIKYFDTSSYLGKIFNLKSNKLLLIILLLSLIVRLLPIFWGVPISPYVKNYHPDEPKVYFGIMNFPRSYFSFTQFKGYGTFIQHSLGFLFIPLKLIKVFGNYDLYSIVVIILARFFNIIMGTTTILFTYILAVKIFDKKTALIAGALLALSFYHVLNSSVITLDVVMSFLLIINFLLCFYAVEVNSLKSYIILGIASGMLLGTKITGGLFLLIPVVLSMRYFINNIKRDFALAILKNLIVYFFVAGFIFLLFDPYVLEPVKYIGFLLTEKQNLIDRTPTTIWHVPVKWLSSIEISMGFPATLLFVAGLIFIRRKNFYMQAALLIFLLEYCVFWRWSLIPRYIISIAPIICIFAASALNYFFEKKNKVIKAVIIGVFLFTISYSAYLCFSGIWLRLNDTRPEAAKFITNNIKAGSSIGIAYTSPKFSWRYHEWRYPKIDFNKFKEEDFLKRPDIIVLSSYDSYQMENVLNSGKINNKYELDRKYYNEWYKYTPPSPEILKFYDNLLNQKKDYTLVKSFIRNINVPIEFPPPEIRIYKQK